jgi:hypothetical protein
MYLPAARCRERPGGDAARSWPIHGVLRFTKADLPMLGLGTTKMRSHLLLTVRALAKRLNASGPFTIAQIDAMARALAGAFRQPGSRPLSPASALEPCPRT